MFLELIKNWCNAVKSLNISGLEEVISKSLILYIVQQHPKIDSLDDVKQLNSLAIYSEKEQKELLGDILSEYKNSY